MYVYVCGCVVFGGCAAELAVDAVLRLKGSNNLEYIQIIKKSGGTLKDSFLAEGFLLDKKIGVGQVPHIRLDIRHQASSHMANKHDRYGREGTGEMILGVMV